MGSSSKNRGAPAAAAPTPATGTAKLPGGVSQQYFMDPAQLPVTGGLVKPMVGPPGSGGPIQGAGLNFMTPQASQQRQQLAQWMRPHPQPWEPGTGLNSPSGGNSNSGSYTTSGRGWRGGPSSTYGGGSGRGLW